MEQKTPLYERHEAAKGKIVPFAGYLLPVVTEGFFPGRDFITERREVGVQMTWPMIAFAAAVVLMGLLPGGLLHWLGLLAARLFP